MADRALPTSMELHCFIPAADVSRRVPSTGSLGQLGPSCVLGGDGDEGRSMSSDPRGALWKKLGLDHLPSAN